MPKLTNRNREHPHNFKKALIEVQLKTFRKFSAEELGKYAVHIGIEPKAPRSLILKAIEEILILDFKKNWQREHGFPFDDIYDQKKYAEHIARIQREQKEKEEAKPLTDPKSFNVQ